MFDCDGVLVDTNASYTEAVIRTVRWLLERDAPNEPRERIDRALVRLFRRSGDWNNDWDLAFGLYCWTLAPPEPPEVAAKRTRAELAARAGPAARRSYEEIRGVFEEIYNGTALARERWGITPRVHADRGLADVETILLERRVVDELRALGVRRFGVVTGRSRADWDAVRERIPLPPDTPVATDDDGAKPDPAPLAKVVREADARSFVVVGDTLGDLRMVQAYSATALGRERTGTSIQLCDVEDEAAYRAAGARVFVRHVAEVPEAIRRL